jgi:hypothetical protein
MMTPYNATERIDRIHDWMAQTREYGGLSALAVLLAGLAAIAGGGLLAAGMPARTREEAFLDVWGAVFAFSVFCNLALIIRKAQRAGVAMWTRLSKTVLYAVAPGLAGGAVVTFAMARAGAVSLLPGTWMVMYGCALLAVRFFMPPALRVIGMLFLTTGAIVFAMFPGEAALHPAVMAGPFGCYHLLFALLLRRGAPAADAVSRSPCEFDAGST